MTPTKTIAILRRLADDWRHEEAQLCKQFGDVIVPRSMRARRIKDTEAIDAAVEMIDRLEEAESDALEQARLNGVGSEREAALMAKLEAAEKDIALKERIIDSLGAELNAVANERAELTDLRNSMTFRTSLIGRIEAEREDLHALIAAVKKQVNAEFRLRMKKEIECNALRAKIAEMEEQEPVAKVRIHKTGGNAGLAWSVAPLNDFDSLPLMRDGDRLYAGSGAKGETK